MDALITKMKRRNYSPMRRTTRRIAIGLAAAALACGGMLPQTITGAGAAAKVQPTPTPAPRRPSGGYRFGNRGYISGKLTAETATSLTIQGFGGTRTIGKATTLTFFSAATGALSAVKPGQNITVRTGSSAALATSLTLVPAGKLFGLVQPFVARSTRPSGTPRPRTAPPAGAFSRPITGTVVSLKGTSLTIKTSAGQVETGSVNSQTKVYIFRAVAGSTIKVGDQVSVATTMTNGHAVAIGLAISSISNTTVGLFTAL